MSTWVEWVPILCLVAGFVLLLILSIIDLRTWLLPNKYVFPFAVLGVVFHAAQYFILLDVISIILGGAIGMGMLLAVRAVGNWHYKQESLGLGDVKLMGAAGLWLGPQGVILAITIGAFAGLLHGIGIALVQAIKTKSKPALSGLALPAGPGFCIGIVALQLWLYGYLFSRVWGG